MIRSSFSNCFAILPHFLTSIKKVNGQFVFLVMTSLNWFLNSVGKGDDIFVVLWKEQ